MLAKTSKNRPLLVLGLSLALVPACGHTTSNRVGLLSLGNLEGATLPSDGVVVEGKDCGASYSLANATRDALHGTPYDTIVDAEVTNTTGLFIWSNCIRIRGKAIDSRALARGGVYR